MNNQTYSIGTLLKHKHSRSMYKITAVKSGPVYEIQELGQVEYENVITEKLGVDPMQINSDCLSAQTNNLVIKDILQPLEDVEKEYYHKRTVEHIKSQGFVQASRMIQDENSKCECLLARDYKDPKSIVLDGVLRRLTPIEYERLQTLPDDYTSGVCKSHRYTAIGNGWTVNVIAHILKGVIQFTQ